MPLNKEMTRAIFYRVRLQCLLRRQRHSDQEYYGLHGSENVEFSALHHSNEMTSKISPNWHGKTALVKLTRV